MIARFIDDMRAQGFAVESICRVLREQGLQIAARTYRAWKQKDRPVADRTITDAMVVDAVREAAWTTTADARGILRRRLTPEGLYGRRKMTHHIRRTAIANASWGAVDRAMRLLGLQGITRTKKVRTTVADEDGNRAKDLLDRNFTAPRPNHTWVMDFTYVRTWAGFVYVAFILDVFSQMIVAWHAQTTMHTDLVLTPLRMALWSREHQGHPVQPGQLRAHSDAGSQGGFNWLSQHLDEIGGWRWLPRTGVRRPVTCPQRCVGSGVRIGHCVPRCVPQDVRPLRGRCSVSSGR